ncbi:Protein mono-ADP-ribosyltransferase PARP15 [Mytilus coruscus]|uniref:Poly [ADP-ribose] polymerase n=1 Tax=Mytilus coruscus TaxID=42192 RepID=A0A6J8EYL2_MYTCO|nr:Protein mono-ADP-ribosyltransferase PARP15 [Mytilus coruscus]
MDNAEIRQLICKKCIVVKGFNNEIQFHEIKKSFPESSRLNLATRTSTLASRDKEWIIQFQSVKDAQRYIQDVRILKCSEGLLDISDCELPCDIPDEWLQDEVISDKSATSPKHVSLGTLQPPPYSPSDPSVPPSQHSTSAYQFPPYDPRYASMQYGPNPQNPYQHQYYPSYGMPWNPSYHPGSSGKEHLPRDQKEQYGPQHAWSQYPGYYVPYGSYPGYGYPPQANFDFHQPVQQLPGQENPSQYTQGNENQGNTTHQSSSSETGKEENVVHSDGEEQIDEEKMEDEPAKASTNMLKVTKLPSDTTEDGLQFFFENTRKFGGGDVEDVEYDEDTKTAIITFEEDEAVDIVLQKIPILFNKKVIDVEAHIVGAEASSDIPEEESHDSSQNTDEPVTICSIEVRGMKENTTQDTIMYYFESKKGAKADVENIEFVEDKDMYIVTFENEEAVETVLSKSHIVDGAKLQVKRHVPLKRYPNKALVKGFSPNTTKDGIINFLEARTKFEVEEVDFGDEDSGKAIVTFCDPIDIGDIQTACKKKALDKNYLTVHPVVVTNCIVVRGFSEKTTESGLEYYFDNKRKSGVEGVTDVKMNRDDNCCVIYFENAEDALLACKRSHTIDNCTLKVQVFYDCLGVPADNEGPKFKPLPSLVITDIDKYKLSFLKNSAHKKETLEKQLEKSHSKITWPASPQENKVIVECTITKETEDCRKLAKTWEIDTRMHIDSFVNLLVEEIHSTLQEAWGPVMQKLREIHISDPDGVTVNLENPPTCEIIITGLSDPVKEVSDKVKRIIDEVSEDLDRKKQLVQEEVSLKRHQLFVLSFSHFSNKIRQEFEQMEIKIDTKKHVITFTGISGNISKVKVTMYETLSNIASATIGKKTPGYIQFLKRQDVKKSIAAKLKSSSLIGVWEIQDNTILMYSMSDEEAVAAADILKDCVVEVKVDVDNVQKSMLSSQKWKQHVQAIQNEFERKSVIAEIVTNQQGQITVYCNTQGEAGLIKENIQDFFLTNTEKEITIDLPPSLLKFLQEEMKDEVENLEKDLRKRNIIVAVKSDGILVKGNAEEIKDAEDEVEALVQKIYKTKHSMDKPGLQELMNSNQGKTKLKQVSKHAGVVISSDSDEDERSAGHIRRRGGAGSDERAVFCGAGGQEVIVVKGDITGLDVDVIVNAANKDLAHSGGLAKVLVNKGGKGIQDECDQYTSNYGQLSEGECFSSGPGKLKCQMIVHAVGPVWQGGSNREEERLHQCVESILVETEQNQHTSVAIPALCTGIFGYPANQATRVIAQTVNDYFSSNRGSTVQRVYLCDVNENSVDLFVKAGDKVFGKRTDGGGRTPSGGGYSDGFSRQAGPISSGNIQIKIVKGELSKMRVDAIVNTTSKDLQLNQGAVSAALLKVGGQALQDECLQNYPKGVGYGEVAVTSGYNLPCSYVLEKFIDGCLQEADSNGCRSIALPAMGTGKLGYPRDQVAKHMYSSVEQFASKNPSSNVTEVLFVLYDKDHQTVKAFEDEKQNRQRNSGRQDRDYTQQPTGYQGRRGWYLNDAFQSDDEYTSRRPPRRQEVLNRVDSDQKTKMEQALALIGQKRPIKRTESSPLHLNPVKAPVRKSKSQNAMKNWEKINKPEYWLEDIEIELAMHLVKNNHPNIDGLQPVTVALAEGYKKPKGPFIQIINVSGQHWVTLSNIGCPRNNVRVFDSWKRHLQGDTKRAIFAIMDRDSKGQVFVDLCQFQRQRNDADCGCFAAASMVAIANGMEPSKLIWDTRTLRSHFVQCLNQSQMKPFPLYQDSPPSMLPQKTYTLTVCPSCKQMFCEKDKQVCKSVKKEQQQQTPQTQGTPQEQDASDSNKEYNVNMGSMVFKVYQGDITAIKVDAIVNGTNVDLFYQRTASMISGEFGAVAKAIKHKGGQELDKQLGDNRKAMKKDGIAVTKHTSGLMCKAVIHLDMTINPSILGKIQMASVAFPALGTSTNTKLKVSDIAEEMFKVVEKFHSNKTNHHVKEVHIVIFQKDMMKDFMEAVKNCVNKSKEGYIGKFMKWTGLGGAQSLKISRHNRHLIGTQVPQNKQMATMVSFVIYARDKSSADHAVQLLEKSVEDDIIERTIRINEVKKLEATDKVDVTVDTGKGEITLRGFTKHVSDAMEHANHIIKTAEQAKQTRQKAKLVTDMVQWHYMEEDKGEKKLVEYPPEVNLILETALKDQKTDASFYDQNGNRYVVDFNSYEEYPADDPTDKVQVLRKFKLIDHAFELPLSWEKMGDKENLKVIQLKPTDQEYQDVSQKFIATSGGTKVTFVKIERIQNKTLYQQFVAKKKSMDATNPKTVNNEKQLWHGFSVDALDSINRYGFNRSYCGKNAVAFGAGVYFAVEVRYSIQDTYSRPDPSGHKRMYLCRVLTGEFCTGVAGMRVPPAKPSPAGSHILYDSVTNDMNNQIMYIIFHDSQAFPEYLVTFKRG